jgi:PAS domain S-box-containing protein
LAKRKILIVDDESTVAKDLEQRLTALGYDVPAVAQSEEEAAAMTALAEPELVLMDIALAGDTGSVDALNKMRARWKVPVVFIIAAADEARVARPGVIEAASYVVKPFTERELHTNLELALAKYDAANAAHEMEDRFFAVSEDMLCMLDFNGFFKRINPAWERTLGYTRKELMSRPFIEFVHPDDRERTLRQNADVRAGGKALSFENRYVHKDGSYRWFHWNAASDSNHKTIYSMARDITAAKKATEEREQLLAKLQAAQAEIRSLREILPICSYCRRIRDEENHWHTVENYISHHTNSRFSHGICPTCLETQIKAESEK